MSASLCSPLHLSVLASYAVNNGLSKGFLETLTLLHNENLASLRARYPEHANSDPVRAEGTKREYSAAEIIKLCHYYAYQACEHSGWKNSEAKKLVEAIVWDISHNVVGWNEAEWGI